MPSTPEFTPAQVSEILSALGRAFTSTKLVTGDLTYLQVRARKGTLVLQDSDGHLGHMVTSLDADDVAKLAPGLTPKTLAAWLLLKGARKIKPARRVTMAPMYD